MKIVKFDNSFSHTPSARSRTVTYIVNFGLQSEIVNFGYSLSRSLFGMRQKCDIYRRFWFAE